MNKIMKKALTVLLGATTMVSIGTLNYAGRSDTVVKAADEFTVNLDVKRGFVTTFPESPSSNSEEWSGDKVYFGIDPDESKNLWKVLESTGLLWADKSVSEQPFDTGGGTSWNDSSLKKWLNGDQYKTNPGKFAPFEQTAIRGNDMAIIEFSHLLNPSLGFFESGAGSNVSRKADKAYWARTGGFVDADGSFVTAGVDTTTNLGIVPFFELDTSKILFTKALGTDSSSFKKVGNKNASRNIFKLTLRDGDTEFATDTLPTSAKQGEEVTINVTKKGKGEYSQTSAILSRAEIHKYDLAYGKIGTAGTGEKTFKIPKNLPVGSYELFVFEEKENGEKKSNSASQVVSCYITIEEAPEAFDVNITAGSHMTKTTTSGPSNQPGVSSAMTSVVYEADEGYYFPETYNVASVNGISVTRVDANQIKVSGTPTGDTDIELIAPSKKKSVKINSGNNMTLSSGSTNQKVPSGVPIAAVVYVANDGYYFPESYKVATQNGISVNRDSDRQITISGTPTGDVNLSLLAATKKDGAEEPANPGVEAPKVVLGANGVYTIGSNDGLVIKSSGALADLTGVYVDDKLVDPSNYTLKSGSTILTLKTSYLNSLSEGKHTLVFKYNDQSAETTFTISKASNTAKTPSTGDTTNVAGLIILSVIAGVGLSYYAKKRYFN